MVPRWDGKSCYTGSEKGPPSFSGRFSLSVQNWQNRDGVTCAVIGDGSLTGGMAFEALNHAGQLGKRLVVVLNDNKMSISHNVGALSLYLTRLRSNPNYFRLKEDIEFLLKTDSSHRTHKWPGQPNGLKDGVRFMLIPGTLFEELGFTYFGPLDGHDIAHLRSVFDHARKINGPVPNSCADKNKGRAIHRQKKVRISTMGLGLSM